MSDTSFGSDEIGRATADFNAIRWRAKFQGTEGNRLIVTVLISPLMLSIRPVVVRDGIEVHCAPHHTAAQMCEAVNRLPGSLVMAHPCSRGATLVGGSVTLSGGLDPVYTGNRLYNFEAPPGRSGGLFFFTQCLYQNVTQIECSFTLKQVASVTIEVLDLSEGFEPFSARRSVFYQATLSPALPSFVLTDTRLTLVGPSTLCITCAAPGSVRAHIYSDDR